MWTALSGVSDTRYGVVDGNVWADLCSSNALVTQYIRPDGLDALGFRVTASSGVVLWYNTDYQGSVKLLTDNSGVVFDKITYTSFGVATHTATSADVYGYAGYAFEATVGLYYCSTRWYDPKDGRWTTQDPLGFAAGDSNLGRYVGNGPTDGTDPTGEVAGFAIVAGLALAAIFFGTPRFANAPGPNEKNDFAVPDNTIADSTRVVSYAYAPTYLTKFAEARAAAGWSVGFNSASQAAGNFDDWRTKKRPWFDFEWDPFGSADALAFGAAFGPGLARVDKFAPRTFRTMMGTELVDNSYRNFSNGRYASAAVDFSGFGILGYQSRGMVKSDIRYMRGLMGFKANAVVEPPVLPDGHKGNPEPGTRSCLVNLTPGGER